MGISFPQVGGGHKANDVQLSEAHNRQLTCQTGLGPGFRSIIDRRPKGMNFGANSLAFATFDIELETQATVDNKSAARSECRFVRGKKDYRACDLPRLLF